MSNFKLSQRSLRNLEEVHSGLVMVVKEAIKITKVDFCVTEGIRTVDRQRKLFEAGATTTMRSRHLDGHAVDLAAYVDGSIRWDWPLYHKIAEAMQAASDDLKIKVEWGGKWRKFPDGPHFQIPWGK